MDENTILRQVLLKNFDFETKRLSKLLENLSDETLMKEVAPGKNRGIYILGHIIVSMDSLFLLLGLRQRMFPQLDEAFIKNPDKAVAHDFSVTTLKKYWADIASEMGSRLQEMSATEWLNRHTAVSEEDFAKEPYRNKMNVLLSRINHNAYHAGQLILLSPTKE